MSSLRHIPKVDRLLADPAFTRLCSSYPRHTLLSGIRTALDQLRAEILASPATSFTSETIAENVLQLLRERETPSLKRVVNGTGIVIHTNLGRAPLPQRVLEQMADSAVHYSNLEFDLASGERGERYSHIEPLLCELTGAEAALAVNNNAAALMLALSAVAKGAEVIVSRGELVEIGGSFRIPEIMEQSGAILREVGATNKTHLRDYKKALKPNSAVILKVSCSNFAITGFTAETAHSELAELAKESGIPLLVDAGSGLFANIEAIRQGGEITVREYLAAGADLVVCSADKLLGASQAGIILGRKDLVEKLKKDPLLRVIRLDKLALAALETTLRIYASGREMDEIPALKMLSAHEHDLRTEALKIKRKLKRVIPQSVRLEAIQGFSMAGGGTLPTLQLPTTLIKIEADGLSPNEIERRLRCAKVPVIGRIYKGSFLLDVRTIMEGDVQLIAEGLKCLEKNFQ